MEVGLAVVAITTAVKDIVEVGQKIYESFRKIPNNFRNAQLVVEDVKEMVEEINAFCDAHKDALDNMKDFHVALQGLLGKFRSFETSVLPLLPQPGGRKRDRFIRGWNAWRNNNSIERNILNLQSDIVTIMRRFVWKSTMRAEVKLETIRQDTSKGLEALEDVRRDVHTLRKSAATAITRGPFEPLGTTHDEFNRNVVMLAQSTPSTSVPMLRTPDVVTEEVTTMAYIKFQVNIILTTLEKVSMLSQSTGNSASPYGATPNIIETFCLGPMVGQASMNIVCLRRSIVQQVINMRNLLDTDGMHSVIMYEGACELDTLSVGLATLGMSDESIQVGKWAITLARALVGASDSNQPGPAAILAFYLFRQSIRYHQGDDKIQSLRAVEEAFTIVQNLWDQYGGEIHFKILRSNVLMQYALLVDNRRSIGMFVEAVQALEGIFNVQAFIRSQSVEKSEWIVQPSSPFIDYLIAATPPVIAITNYGYALQELGQRLCLGGHYETARDLALLSIALCQEMVSICGDDYKANLADALYRLVQRGTASLIPAEERIVMSDECIQLLRELTEKNPLSYARRLVDVLSEKAESLGSLDRDIEAIATWEEAVNIAAQIVQDCAMCAVVLDNLSDQFTRLRRYDDAVRTRKLAITTHQGEDETQAARYFNLSHNLRQLRRYKESADAARISVVLYRRLAMKDPNEWTVDLTEVLSKLAHSLAVLGDYPEVLTVWRESARILDNFLNADSDVSHAVIARYCAALEKYLSTCYLLENEDDSHQISSTALRYFQRLSDSYPQNTDIIENLWYAEFCCAYNMFRVGRLQAAHQYIDNWIDAWNQKLAVIPESQQIHRYTLMMILKANVFYTQGCTKEALSAIQRAHSVSGISVSALEPPCSVIVGCIDFEALIQLDLGNTKEALQAAEKALQLSQDDKPDLSADGSVFSLHAVAFAALGCQNYTRTIETAQEGCNICASPGWQDDEWEYNSGLRGGLFVILSSAEANLGRYRVAMEYARRAVEASLDIANKKWAVSATAAEESFMETRGNMAEILIATGEFAQAREICEERRAYFSKRVEIRMGEYRDLGPILRMLGVLYCSEGRHEEGEAAAQELSRIMKRLGCAFPSLLEQVKRRLRRQAEVPILKVLNDMTQKLDCRHQVEVSSLYEIRDAS